MNTAASEAALDAELNAFFEPVRYRACRPAAARRFIVSATRADGATDTYYRAGGTSIEHALEAQERAGLGGVVRVQALDDLEAA